MYYCQACGKLKSSNKIIKSNIPMKVGFMPEFEYLTTEKFESKGIYGYKVKESIALRVFNFGIGFGYFTDNINYKFCFIPEIGFGYKSLFLIFRRNMLLFDSNDNIAINKNNISLRLYIPFDKRWL